MATYDELRDAAAALYAERAAAKVALDVASAEHARLASAYELARQQLWDFIDQEISPS